jgi:predicted ester cyclase
MSELSQIRDTHYKGISGNDLDLAASVFAEDVETVTPLGVMQDLTAFRQFEEAFAVAVPDANILPIRTFELGDTIITEGSYSGTQTGDLVSPAGTIPASGRSFSFPFADVMQATDGKIVSHHIYWDMLGFMAQLGD